MAQAFPPNPSLSMRPPPGRPGKKRPQARIQAVVEHDQREVAWTALMGGLARARVVAPVTWRVHDRTHLEFAVDYPIGETPSEHLWEAYFFVPESFRLDAATYRKEEIYDDLWSYVRYSVPAVTLGELASRTEGAELTRTIESLRAAQRKDASSSEAKTAIRELRLFACKVRSAGIEAAREVEQLVRAKRPDTAAIREAVLGFSSACASVTSAMRSELAPSMVDLPDDVETAARWVDEDVSLVIETLCATLAVRLQRRAKADKSEPTERASGEVVRADEGETPAKAEVDLADLAASVAARAVAEARWRSSNHYDSVSSGNDGARDVEHIEFRRHVLKRFTASALWLNLHVRAGAPWTLHAFYGVAAGVAMVIGLVAAAQTDRFSNDVLRYALAAAVAYAIRDRMKALLQGWFSGWISRRFPDRRWTIRDDEREKVMGNVRERAGFSPFSRLPAEVLAARRSTRLHPLEEAARPENVLWHQKLVSMGAREGAPNDIPSPVLTEIFRLNLQRWLDNTDDPKGKRIFADPLDARVYSVDARRVYNINVIYRLQRGEEPSIWHRIRLVVSRRGIQRIEEIA